MVMRDDASSISRRSSAVSSTDSAPRFSSSRWSFVVPGMGTLLIDSIVHRDFVVLQAIVLLIAAVVLILNLLIDLSYGVLDPRVRYQ